MNKLDLCLLDCSSIQRYVFGSNKLKSNIGASHIVQAVYDHWIPVTLKKIFSDDIDKRYQNWKTHTATLEMANQPDISWEIGFVGGGSALVLFRSGNDFAEQFIKAWSTALLVNAPGINPVIALLKEIPVDDGDIGKVQIDLLYKTLQNNKNKFLPQTSIDRHGITAECAISGLSAEIYDKGMETWISSVVKSKIENVQAANRRLNEDYAEELCSAAGETKISYHFSEDTENLGGIKGEASQIAIVHIDGNSMGQAFKNCSGLLERRQLAIEVDQRNRQAMRETIRKLVGQMPAFAKRSFFHWKDTSQNWLPLRPIIVNGDDNTFITDARLAFYLAEIFMKAFAAEKISYRDETGTLAERPVSTCAGIAIVKAKYPFYRAYQLAEQLCANAKRLGRPENTSWLDFHIAYSGLTGDLDAMRQRQYRLGDDFLLWRPWKISDAKEKTSFSQVKSALKSFNNREDWPKNKLHDLNTALAQGQAATKLLIEHLTFRGHLLSEIAQIEQAAQTGWYANKTPYYDILEISEFYPDFLIAREE